MQRVYLCVCILACCLNVSRPAEIIKLDRPNGELLIHDFTIEDSTTKNSLGYPVFTAAEMEMTRGQHKDAGVILTPKSASSFFYSFVRQPGQCFDASNFDYISVALKHEDDISFMVGFSSNPNHCDETAESVIRYSLARITSKPNGKKRSVVDIPFSVIPGDASQNNINSIMIGGLIKKPIEVYSIKLKSQSSNSVSKSTIVQQKDQIAADSESNINSDLYSSVASLVASASDGSTPDLVAEPEAVSVVIVEDFATDDANVNALGGTHGSDRTMAQEKYATGQGVFLHSSSSSSYWYTVIPCEDIISFKNYDEVLLDVVGPKGSDFNIRLKTQVRCEADFNDFVFTASSLLNAKLDETQQQITIPFAAMPGFDKNVHTIQSIIIGDFQNEGEDHYSASPMELNVKSLSIRGSKRSSSDDDDREQERIQANEKENPADYESILEDLQSQNGSSMSSLSVLAAIFSAAFLLVL